MSCHLPTDLCLIKKTDVSAYVVKGRFLPYIEKTRANEDFADLGAETANGKALKHASPAQKGIRSRSETRE